MKKTRRPPFWSLKSYFKIIINGLIRITTDLSIFANRLILQVSANLTTQINNIINGKNNSKPFMLQLPSPRQAITSSIDSIF
ncbi:MAG: hypothetical protein CBB79_00820 [Synechococcus sp. TMED19]|nr:MAG: hypothetical protein CBB79_00820 [Synechococcus sp. TMED19]